MGSVRIWVVGEGLTEQMRLKLAGGGSPVDNGEGGLVGTGDPCKGPAARPCSVWLEGSGWGAQTAGEVGEEAGPQVWVAKATSLTLTYAQWGGSHWEFSVVV